ncbi:MAG: ribonuclease VapC [Euryarchaeota archaeon]|nr:ribonuclease VapC [Euryarchaeota archaeon]
MKLILDASALLSGFQPGNECYTVREVIDEVREKNARLRISLSLEEGSLKLVEPGEENLLEIKKAALESGDIAKLSDTDIKLLSIALDFKKKRAEPVIVTDDYNIQNLASRLGMKFSPTTEAGIKKILTWKKICKGCGKKFPIEYQGSCDVCGTKVSKIAKR